LGHKRTLINFTDAIELQKSGLRATAVINLRRAGLSYAQIGDIVGMSAKMVERYCRNADMRLNNRVERAHLERASGSGLAGRNS
jgi:DNA-binding CsgD family transcriptional regulator